MPPTAAIGLLLVLINVFISYRGFTNKAFYNKFKFSIYHIQMQKQYYRLITSSFLHADWRHLIFNMFSLYAFSGLVETYLGYAGFFLVYFLSSLCGDLLSLFVHRNHSEYTAVGASGAVCGIIFAALAIAPSLSVGFFFLPISIPAWLYGILYVLYCIFGIRSNHDGIGHDAHLGGALTGAVTAVLIHPAVFAENYITIMAITLPTAAFICLIIARPHLLLTAPFSKRKKDFYSVDHIYNEQKSLQQQDIDHILDKVNKRGMDSLSSLEKEKLKHYARSVK